MNSFGCFDLKKWLIIPVGSKKNYPKKQRYVNECLQWLFES